MEKSKSSITTKVFRLVCLIAFISACSIGYLFQWANSEIEVGKRQVVDFSRGTSLTTLAVDLENKKIVTNALLFKVYTKFFGGFHNAQAGKYAFKGSVSPVKVIASILSGKTYRELIANITIPEGFTIDQVLRRLEANGIGKYQ